MSLGQAVAQVAPLYNLGLVLIIVGLFFKLFTTRIRDRRVYLMPWKILFFAVMVFVLEEVITIMRALDIINIPKHINGFFELIIVCTFIYMLLLQKEHMKK